MLTQHSTCLTCALKLVHFVAVLAQFISVVFALLLIIVCRLCFHILSLGGQLVLLVRLAHVYGSLFTLQQWILTVDDQPGLAGPHGAGQRLRLTRVSRQRV